MIDYLRLQVTRWLTLRTYKKKDWRRVPIKESGQLLIKVPDEIAFPFYCRVLQITKNEEIYLREEVLKKNTHCS